MGASSAVGVVAEAAVSADSGVAWAGAMVTWGITARAAWRSSMPIATTAIPIAATTPLPFGLFLAPAIWCGWLVQTVLPIYRY